MVNLFLHSHHLSVHHRVGAVLGPGLDSDRPGGGLTDQGVRGPLASAGLVGQEPPAAARALCDGHRPRQPAPAGHRGAGPHWGRDPVPGRQERIDYF